MIINRFSETKMVRSSIPLGMHPLCDFVKKPLCAFVVKKLTTKEHKGFTKEHKEKAKSRRDDPLLTVGFNLRWLHDINKYSYTLTEGKNNKKRPHKIF